MKACLYCCNTPIELVESFGLDARRFVSSGATSDESRGEIHPGVCSWCKTIIGSQTDDDILVASRTCDQAARVLDFRSRQSGKTLLITHMPATRTKASYQYFKSEILWQIDRLSEITGKSPNEDRLDESIRKWNRIRKSLRENRGLLSGSAFVALVHKIMDGETNISVNSDFSSGKQDSSSMKIAVAGCPTSKAEISFLEMIEKNGASVVLDATCTGDRFSELEVEESGDPVENLAKAYFERIPCIRARPNTEFFDWMKIKTKRLGVEGVIWKTLRGCDMWTAELERAKTVLDLPVLGIDISYSDVSSPRIQTRVEAFLESLR